MGAILQRFQPLRGSKYRSYIEYAAAVAYRNLLRQHLRALVTWGPLHNPQPGCTAIIGLCSKLPGVLLGNLRCLYRNRWPDLKRLVITVDNMRGSLPAGLEELVSAEFPELPVTFCYYSQEQAAFAEKKKLPFVFSWLSWCICLQNVSTETVLIHDYDALILGDSLERRYSAFRQSGAKIQGIRWYDGNGILPEDHLATTFEAFVNTAWLRSLRPIDLFHKVGVLHGRLVDFDTMLEAQARRASETERTAMDMELAALAHPSQMIHQYTMFRRFPQRKLPCFSTVMLPFFYFLSGDADAFARAMHALREAPVNSVDLLGDGTRMNLTMLDTDAVDWMLKIMLQVLSALRIPPFQELVDYGVELYRAARTPAALVWRGDFDPEHREWLASANLARSAFPQAPACSAIGEERTSA